MRYDFESKEDYREAVHEFIFREWGMGGATKSSPRPQIGYLESGQGLETLTHLDRGVHPTQLLPITASPAMAATITRKVEAKTGKRVRSCGGDIEKVLMREEFLDKYGYIFLGALNLDFTNCITEGFLDKVERIANRMPWGVLSLTVLRGREKDIAGWREFKNVGRRRFKGAGQDAWRLGALYAASHMVNETCRRKSIYGTYRSSAGNQTMLFYAESRDTDRAFLRMKEAQRRGDRKGERMFQMLRNQREKASRGRAVMDHRR